MNRRYVFRNMLVTLTIVLFLSNTGVARSSNKWRLQFSGAAHSDGVIEILITPVGGEPVTARIEIENGTFENNVAKAVVKALKAQLPEEAFHVERDDGEDVLIKKRHGAANFDLEIVSNSVEHVRINPQHE